MTVWTIIRREMRFRPGMFLGCVLIVAVAVATVLLADMLVIRTGEFTAKAMERNRTANWKAVQEREAAVQQAGADLEDAMRKNMRELGFNVLILPQQQDLKEFHLTGSLSATIPQTYAATLQASKIMTINHLLPIVTRRMQWEERGVDVILVGTEGEVPIAGMSQKKPLLDSVAAGQMVVGHSIALSQHLEVGHQVTLLGREFEVSKIHPERGSTDDVTVWISLPEAQEMLGMQNLLHGILALECGCEGDRITQIRHDIQTLLPGTQVMERYSQAVVRAESRNKAKQVAEEALQAEKHAGAERMEQLRTASIHVNEIQTVITAKVVPLVVLAAAMWVGLLAWINVRQRREEIGILRAIGVSTSKLLVMFLGKAIVVGLLGGLFGFLIAWSVGRWGIWWPDVEQSEWSREMLRLGAYSLVIAPALSAISSWFPALLATRQDPAQVLQAS